MRILFVTHNIPRFPGDAAGNFILRLAVALQEQGAMVDVIAPGSAGLAAQEVLDGVSITRVRYGSDARMTLAYGGTMAEEVRSSWTAKLALVSLLRSLRRTTVRHLADAARSNAQYDFVHAHWWFPSALALFGALDKSGPPLAITMHGSDVRLAQGVAPARALMRAVLQRAALRTAVSSWLADIASRIAPDARIHVEPMPVDTSSFVPPAIHRSAPNADGVDASRRGILFVGRLNAQKGLAELLDALTDDALQHATLDVVGDGPDGPALKARAQQLGVDERVRWHGALRQPELVPRYQRAAVVAMPSVDEGLGLVAVEAQLCETPVVAYASGGLPDVVRIDAGGTLVTVGDRRAFAHALARLLDDPSLAQREGRTARAAMLAHFSPAEVATRYLRRYREVVTG